MDFAAELRRQPREVQDLHLDGLPFQRRASDLDQPPRLGHLARAGVLAAGRAVDEQDAARTGRIVMPHLGFVDRGLGIDPIGRKLMGGVGVARAGRPGVRRLALICVGVPRRRGDPGQLRRERLIRPIGEATEEPPLELGFLEPRAGHSLARRGCGCGHRRSSGVVTTASAKTSFPRQCTVEPPAVAWFLHQEDHATSKRELIGDRQPAPAWARSVRCGDALPSTAK